MIARRRRRPKRSRAIMRGGRNRSPDEQPPPQTARGARMNADERARWLAPSPPLAVDDGVPQSASAAESPEGRSAPLRGEEVDTSMLPGGAARRKSGGSPGYATRR